MTAQHFSDLLNDSKLLLALDEKNFITPTPVQQQAIPLIFTQRDLLVSAKTGSGKTAAFLLPILQNLLHTENEKTGIKALVLVPTRELAQQIFKEAKDFTKETELSTVLITGGEDFRRQQTKLRQKPALVIATAGRMTELLNESDTLLNYLQFLVLDEADRMLDMGFSDAVLNIVNYCPNQRQTLLFSATLTHKGVNSMARKVLNNYETLMLNTLHDTHSQIQQQFITTDDKAHKQQVLTWLLQNETYEKALIFTNSRLETQALEMPLRISDLRVAVLHGEMDQKQRQRTMKLFHEGTVNILVATDLAARGLDVQGIELVVHFDVPRNGVDYTHRIGRTGRFEAVGTSIMLVEHFEWNVMAGIERFLKQDFTKRDIDKLKARYQGPKKTKNSSGKAVKEKKKEIVEKKEKKKVKLRHRDQKNIGKRRKPTVKTDLTPQDQTV